MSSSESVSSSEDELPAFKRARTGGSDDDQDEEEESRPSFGLGMKFNMGAFVSGGVESLSLDGSKGSKNSVQPGETEESKESSTGRPDQKHVSTYGIGAQLMSKMGYVSGKGLGQEGKGIVNPIEQKLRPSNLGLGGISEKVGAKPKPKSKVKKTAVRELDEEGYEKDVPNPDRVKKPKDVYKTMEEMEREGLHVPSGFREIIDMSSSKSGVKITDLSSISAGDDGSAASSSISGGAIVSFDKARSELETYARDWDSLVSQKEFAEQELSRLEKQLKAVSTEEEKLASVLDDIERISSDEGLLESSLEVLQGKYYNDKDLIADLRLDQAAVAAIYPVFSKQVETWDPLDSPTQFKTMFMNLKTILRIDEDHYDQRRHPVAFHALMNQVWLPYVQSFLNNNWDPTQPYRAITLIQEWEPLLSPYLRQALFSRVLIPKLKSQVDSWNSRGTAAEERAAQSRNTRGAGAPHLWLFPWLPYLGDLLDEVIEMVKSKFAMVLKNWKPEDESLADDLGEWRQLFGEQALERMLVNQLVPRLGDYLRRNLIIDPSNQDIAPLEHVLKWRQFLTPNTLGIVLSEQFFPKWMEVLWQWLTSANEASLGEIADWIEHWIDGFFPDDVLNMPAVADGFKRAFDLVNTALDLGPRRDKLEHPRSSSSKAKSISGRPSPGLNHQPTSKNDSSNARLRNLISKSRNASFKQVLEDYCDGNGFLLQSLDDFDDRFGQRLFRVTASVSGKGGVKAFIYKDVLYIQRRKGGSYEPIALDNLGSYLDPSL